MSADVYESASKDTPWLSSNDMHYVCQNYIIQLRENKL